MNTIFELRRIVFIEGQNVPEDIERDVHDKDAIHLIAFHEDQPVGTARLLLKGDVGKIGRVAVLEEQRGLGLGKALMLAALRELRNEHMREARLSSQTHALGFYEALGFVAEGPEFMDAGIPHRDMALTL